MLLWVQNERGYKSGFAEAKFMARYGQWPRGLGEFPIAPDAALSELAEVAGDRLPQASAEGGSSRAA